MYIKLPLLLLFVAAIALAFTTKGLDLISASYNNLGNFGVFNMLEFSPTGEIDDMQMERSMALFSSALRLSPDSPASLLGTARLSIIEGDLPEARETLVEIDGRNHEIVLWLKGEVLYGLGDRSGALALWKRAVPTRWIVDLGVEALENNDINEAILLFENALEVQPGSANAHYAIGTAYTHLDDQEKAEKHLRMAIELRPGIWWYHLYLAQAYDYWGRTQDAITEYKIVISLNPSRSDILNRIEELEAGENK